MSLQKRKCFYEVVDGTIRPFEWALVNVTGFGHMVEPYWPFDTGGTTSNNDNFSTNNEFQRVDEFRQASEVDVLRALSGGEERIWLHGGRHYPRTGR